MVPPIFLSSGSGDSPGALGENISSGFVAVDTTDLARVQAVVSGCSMMVRACVRLTAQF